MDQALVKQKLYVTMKNSPDIDYIDQITGKIIVMEKLFGAEMDYVNHHYEGHVGIKFKNGEVYEIYNYQEKDAEVLYKKYTGVVVSGGAAVGTGGGFTLAHFIVLSIFLGLVVFGIIVTLQISAR